MQRTSSSRERAAGGRSSPIGSAATLSLRRVVPPCAPDLAAASAGRACSIPGCGRPVCARGWCEAHYARWKRHGDPLGGRTRVGEPLGSATPRGKVSHFLNDVVLPYIGDDCLIWPFARNDSGYGMIKRDKRQQRVHRIVCEHRHGPPPTPEHQAAHSCGKGHEGCVNQMHLSWKTPLENKADELIHGTRAAGERNGGAKLTEAQAREIRALRGQMPQRELAERFCVSKNAVSDIQCGKRWRSLDAEVSA